MTAARPTVALDSSASAYRIVAVAAAARGNTYWKFSIMRVSSEEGYSDTQIRRDSLPNTRRIPTVFCICLFVGEKKLAIIRRLPQLSYSLGPNRNSRTSKTRAQPSIISALSGKASASSSIMSNETTATEGGAMSKNIAGLPFMPLFSWSFPKMNITRSK